jgi:hypothetical protein
VHHISAEFEALFRNFALIEFPFDAGSEAILRMWDCGPKIAKRGIKLLNLAEHEIRTMYVALDVKNICDWQTAESVLTEHPG